MATKKKKKITGPTYGRKLQYGERITEQDHEDAMRILRAEYFQGVRSIVQEIKDAIKDGEITDGDEITDRVSQDVGGSAWVIYTHLNFQVLMCSDHHDAYTEAMGEPPVENKSDVNWAALAHFAMEQDVNDLLGAEGIT